MLTKTDFLTYLDAPMHLWAKAHDQFDDQPPSVFEQFLAQQGQQVEILARHYLEQVIISKNDHLRLHWQPAYDDGRFQIRADALIQDENLGCYDLYEIKSSTSVKKLHEYDLAFQVLLLESRIPVRHVYLLHIDNAYMHDEQLDLESFFATEDVTGRVADRRDDVAELRQAAWDFSRMAVPDPTFACIKPRSCPCPSLCHPALPENPIYNLPQLGKKALPLREKGILAIEDIPPDFKLSSKQRLHVDAVRSGQRIINTRSIRDTLADLTYPLYFLDYETFNPAVPLFSGYRPYEHIVFQYSLFVVEKHGAKSQHHEILIADGSAPAPHIVYNLLGQIGQTGSVVVWNKSFEAGRNQDLARHCPEVAGRLLDINERLYDLMLIFRDGHYIDPRFRGSASLKAVLPVLCPDLRYADLMIQDGESAMLTWYKLHTGAIPLEKQKETIDWMRAYCKMDTYGMVAIWDQLFQLCEEDR
jgi:hypothetical protein